LANPEKLNCTGERTRAVFPDASGPKTRIGACLFQLGPFLTSRCREKTLCFDLSSEPPDSTRQRRMLPNSVFLVNQTPFTAA